MFYRYRLKFWLCATTLPLLMAATSTAHADAGSIGVVIANDDGRPLEGVSIVVESRAGEIRQATTDSTGKASVKDLETGLYRITASLDGYIEVVEPGLRVVRDKTVPFRVLMRTADERIEEVVVVAEAIAADPYGAASNTFLGREHLRTAPGSGADVLRALDGLPGLASTGEFASFTVRGRGPRDNLILVDGFPYDKVVHFDESIGEQSDISGGGRFSIFAPTVIEGAEFSPGGWSSAYGGRNGSLLKLDVARGNPSPSASLRLDIAGGEALYDGPSGVHDDTSLIFTARQFDFGRLFDLIDEKDQGDPVMTDLILKTHTQLDSSNELEFLLLHTTETYDRDAANVLESKNLKERELIDTEQDSTLFGVTWSRLFGDDGQWENRIFFRDTDKTSREGEAFPNSMPMIVPVAHVPVREDILTLEEKETEIGWRSDLSTSNRWGVFSAGLRVSEIELDFATTLADDWVRYVYERGDFRPDPTQRFITLTPDNTNSAFAESELQYAAYVEQVFELGRWDFRTGMRYDYDGFSDENYVSPRIGANYRISPTTRLSVTAGTFYQSPRFLDRAADPANSALENEKTNHMSLGINRRIGSNWDVLVETYYQQLRDLVTDPDAVTGLAANNGEGTSYGLDVVVNRRLDNGWSANAVYSYNDATLDDNDGNGEYDAPFNHEHLLSIGANWEINNRWLASFRWKYSTGRPRGDFIIHEDVLRDDGGPLRYSQEFITNNTMRWDDYHQLDIRVDYRRPLGPVDLIAFVDVLNVYGSATSDEREFNPVTGEFKVDDGEPTPLIGLRVEKTWK